MKHKILKVADAGQGAYLVYRVKGKPGDQITGTGLSASVQAGSLVISDSGGIAIYIYSPGQWITVNTQPI
jgi:hypothetical protein